MTDGAFWQLAHVADAQLECELARLLTHGARTEARILAHLAAVEERRLHLEAGYSSLFDYCCRRLALSESEAFHRITAARLARRFPAIFSLIEQRTLHLAAVCLLRDYLTPDNHRELLNDASRKSKLQVQELLARRFPRPDIATTIRKLPAPRAQSQSAAAKQSAPSSNAPPHAEHKAQATETPSQSDAQHIPSSSPTTRAIVEPLSAARYRIQLNASAQLKEKLERAAELLSHTHPRGDLAAVIERAVDLLLEQTLKQRFAQTKRPRGTPGTNAKISANTPNKSRESASLHLRRRRHVPNATKRNIATRDALRCTFVSTDGQRCGARHLTQIHHDIAFARGGRETVGNLRLLCASHNRLLAERDFGRAHVTERIQHRARE